MNPGLVISFIIAAMLMLSIVRMNLRVSTSSIEITLTQITREKLKNVVEMLNDDIPNMGYNIETKTDPVLTHASGNKIQFYRNVYNNPDRDPELITWEYLPAEELSNTVNPDDRLLIRIEENSTLGVIDTTRITSGVTEFNLRYYDLHGQDLSGNMSSPGAVPASLAGVRQIYMEIEVQSAEPVFSNVTDSGRFIRSVYEKRYSPPNIE